MKISTGDARAKEYFTQRITPVPYSKQMLLVVWGRLNGGESYVGKFLCN